MIVRVTPMKANAQARRYFQDIEKRWKAYAEEFLFRVATFVRAGVFDRIPRTDETRSYRNSLLVERVELHDGACFLVSSKTLRHKVKKDDTESTVLFVRPKPVLTRRVPPSVWPIVHFSPWTLDTIPFFPDDAYVRIVSRRTTREEVAQVRQSRISDRNKWVAELLKAGFVVPQKAESVDVRETQTIPDTAFEVLRLELGYGGSPAQPHWRPTIMEVRSSELPRLLKAPDLRKTLADPGYTSWLAFPGPKYSGTGRRALSRYSRFQRALRVRF